MRCILNESYFTLIFFQASITETSRKMFCQLSLARFADLPHENCLIFYSSVFYFIFATCFSRALKCLFQMQIWMIKVISMEENFLVVNVPAFQSDDPSLNAADICDLFNVRKWD